MGERKDVNRMEEKKMASGQSMESGVRRAIVRKGESGR